MGGVDMKKMDDAAILQRAKELCAKAGIAWDRFTAPVPDARILNDGERTLSRQSPARSRRSRPAPWRGRPAGENPRVSERRGIAPRLQRDALTGKASLR